MSTTPTARLAFCALVALLVPCVTAGAWGAVAVLRQAPHHQFPHATDSNSPGHWDGERFYLFNSAGHPYRSAGSNVFQLRDTAAVTFDNAVNGGRWMEATWRATDGTLYGWYHHEPAGLCPGTTLTAPEIGAARSTNNGASWTDLGIILRARPGTLKCDAQNGYFAGGHGDFSVMLDAEERYLYVFFGNYAGELKEQGIALARMTWSDRDAPVGKVWKWCRGGWQEAGLGGFVSPIFPATVAWERLDCEAFWGPSVHWNHSLRRYVMLLNRAKGTGWVQEGIYLACSTNLADPSSWSVPGKLLSGGAWYPQVIGLEPGRGTDKSAGAVARFYMGGVSDYEIVFQPAGSPPADLPAPLEFETGRGTFVSADGEAVTAVYFQGSGARDRAFVQLLFPGRGPVELDLARSGSGARYTNESAQWWEHQGEATYDAGGTNVFRGRLAPKR